MALLEQVLRERGGGDLRHVLVLGDRQHLRLRQAAKGDAIFQRHHGELLRRLRPARTSQTAPPCQNTVISGAAVPLTWLKGVTGRRTALSAQAGRGPPRASAACRRGARPARSGPRSTGWRCARLRTTGRPRPPAARARHSRPRGTGHEPVALARLVVVDDLPRRDDRSRAARRRRWRWRSRDRRGHGNILDVLHPALELRMGSPGCASASRSNSASPSLASSLR